MEVFVYGTLTDPDRAESVLSDHEYRGRAVLEGCHRVEGRYPTLAPDGRVAGRILATDDAAALDRYEGVDSGLYVRVTVPVASSDPGEEGGVDGTGDRTGTAAGRAARGTVETYVGDPDRLDAPTDWPGDGPLAERVREYVRSRPVRVRLTADGDGNRDRDRSGGGDRDRGADL